ncbi:dipicolinate synthase subunit B [Hydrogenibacillus schlegelii]|uniref:Dipicolinate synthase subunit B n=1 Tax=Hydrogenibacillus schlegelii TaxID=1484 RepID=A0A2T5GD66_HYDSH|nr:dipicolinate synthase subunit B [Hydrogenibacillus schlegelii]PTQ54127.1 MAG: Dipicolinate synthase subunit B [Hydrogenibacillus schlegelii]
MTADPAMLHGKTIGFGITGSHCTYAEVLGPMEALVRLGARVIPVATHTVLTTDTRFGKADDWVARLEAITGERIRGSIPEVEPFGPKRTLDAFVISPMTGNTLARFANAITDSPVLMAAKATLRNGRPVILAVSTNDGLGLNAQNIAKLLVARNVYFVPFGQDDPLGKPTSLVARMDLLVPAVAAALEGRQLQPLLVLHPKAMEAIAHAEGGRTGTAAESG